MLRIFSIVFMLFFSVSLLAPGALAAGKVGYISVQGIVSQSDIGKEARDDLDAFRAKKNREIERMRKGIVSLNDRIQKIRASKKFDRAEFTAKLDELNGKKRALERYVEDVNAELISRDKAIVAEIIDKVGGVLNEIASEEGYDVILRDPKSIAFLTPGADLTGKVVERLNRMR